MEHTSDGADDAGKLEQEERKLQMDAVSLEYTTLRAEIAQRSDHQNRFLQLHLTALTFLAGAIIAYDAYWGIFLVPIEAALFGLWWLDHAFTIHRIGLHLASWVETNVSERIARADWVMVWERGWNVASLDDAIADPKLSDRLHGWYTGAVGVTFLAPGTVALGLGAVLLSQSWEWLLVRQLLNAG